MLKYVIHITTLKDPVTFFAKGQTRAEARAEALAYIHAWPLHARNQPCGFRITESHWMYRDNPPPLPGTTGEQLPSSPERTSDAP